MELKKDYLKPMSEIAILQDIMVGGINNPSNTDGEGLPAPTRLYV